MNRVIMPKRQAGKVMLKSRVKNFLLGAMCVSAAILVWQAIDAPLASAAVSKSGNWSLTAFISANTSTPMLNTNVNGHVSSCVSVNNFQGVGGVWSFELIYYDGGRNIVYYLSGDHEGNATACSPRYYMGKGNRIYDRIILINAGAGAVVKDGGRWTLTDR